MEKRYATENLIIFGNLIYANIQANVYTEHLKFLKWEESHRLFLRMGKKKIL